MAQERAVTDDKLPERNYQCRFPAITSISNLQEARNRGCFYIAFERNGYTLDDVEESQLYVYVGKQNEHKNFVPDTAAYGDEIDASDGWITTSAMLGAKSYPYSIAGVGSSRTIEYYNWDAISGADADYVRYDGDLTTGKYPASHSGYDSNPELSKWRKVNLNNRGVDVFKVGTNGKSVSLTASKYVLQRDGVFDNPKADNSATTYYNFGGYNSGSVLDNPSAIYNAAGVINDSAGFIDASSKVMLEVHFEDIFYTDAVSYENIPGTGADGVPAKVYSNIDFDPRNGKLQISTKDRDKLLFDILKGKTPIFFMIVEKLNKSYSGLANLYVTDGDGKISAISTKKQVIADRYRNVGDVIWNSGATLSGRTIDRICVDLAQGDEGAYKRNPGFDDLQRTVWVSSHTDSGAYITCYDYYTGNKIFERPFGAYRINAMATNPADRSLVFVMVNNNNDTGFASVNRIYRSGEYSEICKIDDYAKDSAFSMIGAATTANVANRILGGVVAKKSDGNADNNGFWFTFIVNREFTVSVRISLIDGTRCTGDTVKKTFADRMHYGLFHGKNFNGVYSNAPQNDSGTIKYGAKRAAHSKYLSGVEYGVKKNRNNVIGITNSVEGDVYVNGHTYFHFDNTSASYSLQKLEARSPIFSDHRWDHESGTNNEGCGMRYYAEGSDNNGFTDRVEPFIKSLVPDLTTGRWKVNSRGKYVTEYRSPFRPGFFPPRTFEVNGTWNINDVSFTSRAMAHMTAGKHYVQRHDGEHRCSMSMIAWKGRKPTHYQYTTSKLGDIPNSWDAIEGGKGDVVKYVKATSGNVEFTDEVRAGFYNTESVKRRKPIRLKTGKGSTTAEGDFQCGYSDNLTENYGGSGWDCHMADATMNYSVENDNHGGGMFFIMLESGFIYNANSYDAVSATTTSAANYRMDGLCDNNARFWKTNGLSEDSSGQLVFNGAGGIKMAGSVIDFDHFTNNINDSGSPDGATDAFKFQRGNTSRSAFINKFDCCWADTIYAPNKNGQPPSAIGYMEDARWSTDNPPGYRAKTGATVHRVTDYTSSNEIVCENGEKILMSNYSPKTGHYGMTVPLSANGSLVTRGPSIYESVRTDDKCGVVKATFGDGAAISTDGMCIDGVSSYSVITDDSNQMYVGCYSDGSERIDAVLRLIENKVSGCTYGPVYARDGLQVTNFGHNLCTHPYFEHAAWTTQNDNVTYNYDRYFGAKDLVDTKKLTPDARRDIVLGSFSIGANNIDRYNDDSIGMNGVKCLGYCWTRSTKVHPMDVPPSGDLVIIDHYVLPGNDCDDIDTASMGKYSNSPNSDFYSKGVITYAEATTAAAGYPAFASAVSALSAVSYSEFTTDRLKVLLSSCEGFSTYENDMKGVEVEDKSKSWVSGGKRTIDVVGVGRPKSGLPRAPKTFWDFTTEETLVFDREDDEWAAVMAYAETGMIKTNPIYLSDFSTVVEHPVSYRCAGYDDLYTCHLCSIYDCGTYDIDEVEYTFEQMDDISESNMARKSTRRLRGTELSSMTIGDTDLGRKVAEISKSNNEINYVLDTIQYTSYHDAMCCSADVIQMFGTGWNSINAYGKPDCIKEGAITGATYMGHPLSEIYGQTAPKQWYGTEVYTWVYEKDTDNRITYMHQLNNRTSAYGFHPSVYPDAAATGPTGSDMNAFPAGAWVQNAELGLNTNPHLVYAKATTNEFCYCDPHESAKKIELDLGQNKVWVYERWPTQIWSTHCENSRGGLRLFGDCPDFDEEN